jgi:DNA-binding PadR family transcriptional regulator
MRGPSTPLRGALLGLLLERPGHGGELVSRLKGRLGETWRINYDDVYRLLKRLEEEGLASSRDEPKHSQRGTHVVYHPTEQTRAAVETWMETLLPREPVRLGLQAKLAVAEAQDVPRLRLALREYERECLVLAQLVLPADGEPRSWRALFRDCTRDAVYGMLLFEIEWAARTRRRIDEYAARNP